MGYAHDWVSVAGLTKDEVLARLGVVDRGEPIDFPRRGQTAWAITPQGRVVVVMGYGELSPGHVAEVSEGASVIAARAEGNDCTSSAWGYEDGRRMWSVETEFRDQGERLYDEDSQDALSVQGDPPSEFAAIWDRHLAARDAEDDEAEDFLFMAPLELAEVLGGWAPEGDIGQDLQFFRAVSNQGGAAPPSVERKPRPVLFILLIAVAAALTWTLAAGLLNAK
jgi:hypothetical protein